MPLSSLPNQSLTANDRVPMTEHVLNSPAIPEHKDLISTTHELNTPVENLSPDYFEGNTGAVDPAITPNSPLQVTESATAKMSSSNRAGKDTLAKRSDVGRGREEAKARRLAREAEERKADEEALAEFYRKKAEEAAKTKVAPKPKAAPRTKPRQRSRKVVPARRGHRRLY